MKEKFMDSSVSFIMKYNMCDKKKLDELKYGLEGIYLTITKMIVLIILSLLLGIFKEFILVTITFNIIRYTGFGFHAEKSWQCLLCSVINFVIIPYLLFNFQISNIMIYIMCSLSIICYLLFAPADTVKRPLKNKKKRIIRKIGTVVIGIIYSLIIVVNKNILVGKILLSSLIILDIVVNPLTYKLFNQPFNNYKKQA